MPATRRRRLVHHRAGAGGPKLLESLGWSVADVDLWEVNEAFAVVPMAFMHEMGVRARR
jgi:acetyl-CoA acetyltransferase